MTDKDEIDTPYTVGYGKPPTGSRWKPGQSGNPKGREKGSSIRDLFLKAALSEATTRRGLEPNIQALFFAMFEHGRAGDRAAVRLLLQMSEAYLPKDDDGGEAD